MQEIIEAGRETDVRVAIEIMEWKRVKQQHQTCSGQNECWLIPGDQEAYDSNCICHRTPLFSTDISAAMQVLDKMDVWHIEKSDLGKPPYRVFVAVHEGKHSSRMKRGEAESNSLPLAICRAALATKGCGA